MAAASLHPQNERIGDEGLDLTEFLSYYRFPPVYVTRHGEVQHETPLCPHVHGYVHYSMCREDALYVFGERWTIRRFRRERATTVPTPTRRGGSDAGRR